MLGPLIALVSVVPTGAAADHVTDVTSKVNVDGDYEACKDLLVGVEVYDDQGYVIASCCWDGRCDALGETKVSENHLSRTVDRFIVKMTVRYKNQLLLDERVFIRVIPGQGVIIEFNGRTIELRSANGTWGPEEPLRVVRTIDGKTVGITFRPSAKVEHAEQLSNQWVVDFLYSIDGDVIVHDKKGDYHITFQAHVKHTPLKNAEHDYMQTCPYGKKKTVDEELTHGTFGHLVDDHATKIEDLTRAWANEKMPVNPLLPALAAVLSLLGIRREY
ncbi:Uncharacterized protein MK0300 [Methanopyrus kandleri AV19]|uniref:Uncharacterized protein n=1 Tax=Methanopyrus kandleri (strain AV19 / DSM 6324 / JCM 9639 / NBRC 100938) TaxID=190192 RepID=Q8TYJ7_METKA|nr:Uncharacterized protein MK0300 [Methanopyrus kandleri AV19]